MTKLTIIGIKRNHQESFWYKKYDTGKNYIEY